MTQGESDERIESILKQLQRYATGDYRQPLVRAGEADGLDAVALALNNLGEELARRKELSDRNERRTQELLDTLLRYILLDFSQRAPVGDDGDEIDALGAGLNALGEEVIDHMNRLRDSEAQLQTIFRHAPDPVVVIDGNGTILRWNAAATRIFGWEADEVMGRPLHEIFVPPLYRERHVKGIQRFLISGEGPILNRTTEFPALCKNGREIPVELTVSPAKVDDDYWFVGFLRDISERKWAEEQVLQLNATLEQRVADRTEALHASERKYRHLFENNPMPLWVLDLETLRFLDVNESAVRHYGYSREEFLAMTSLDIRPEDDRSRYLQINRTHRGTQNMGVWRHLKKDGSVIFAQIVVHEMIFEAKPARLVLSNDVTEMTKAMQELQRSETRFRRVFDSKMTGFFFWDDDGTITEANDLFLEMTGYTRSDVAARKLNINLMTPGEYAEVQSEALHQIRSQSVCEPFEKEYIRKDGSRLPVLIGAANINDGDVLKCVTCVMDISQRRVMEEEIRELNRTLETRIATRTRELEEANRELESFSYSVSHDLRAPLRAIHGYSQMLFEDHGRRLDDEGRRLINVVQYNARRMGQLVDDLLAFSRLGKRTMAKTTVDVTALVSEILDDFGHAEKQRVRLTIHPLGTALADPTLLSMAFQNLLSNAIKYSAKKSQPEIEIGVRNHDDGTVYFVRDNGAGFDMAYYGKMFGVFERLHQHDEFDGTGVGLAIVQRIIQRHGGEIWAEGKVGEGAVFYFTLGGSNHPAGDSGNLVHDRLLENE